MGAAYEPVIVAHRGLHAEGRCENSLDAFSDAYFKRIPWVECDVWASADGVPVVIHDETLDRTTSGHGLVAAPAWKELATLQVRLPDGSLDHDDHPCSLVGLAEQVFRLSDALGLLIEIKPPDALPLVRACVNALEGRCTRWMLQSFHEANLVHALTLDVDMPVAFLVEDRESLERGIANGWRNIHLLHELLDEPTARRLRDAGVVIGVWTPNAPEDLRRVIDLRADMIITDEPLRAMAMLRGIGGPPYPG